jgi:hypothetical protein
VTLINTVAEKKNFFTSMAVGTLTTQQVGQLRNRCLISSKIRYFSLLHSVKTKPQAHPASYPMGIWDLFPPGEVAGA